MTAEKRSCENCGNRICADSIVAIFWDDCVASGFARNWMPYTPPKGEPNDVPRSDED